MSTALGPFPLLLFPFNGVHIKSRNASFSCPPPSNFIYASAHAHFSPPRASPVLLNALDFRIHDVVMVDQRTKEWTKKWRGTRVALESFFFDATFWFKRSENCPSRHTHTAETNSKTNLNTKSRIRRQKNTRVPCSPLFGILQKEVERFCLSIVNAFCDRE